MNSHTLITRLVRLVETSGSSGDGAAAATAYAEAVAAANARLEGALSSLDGGQVSEAVRQMEEEPRLLDEVGELDFHQRALWTDLCQKKGWTVAPPIDQTLVERLLAASKSSAMIEPANRAYRKAMRSRDDRQIVAALRRLVALEPTPDRQRDLARAEAGLQKTVAGAFRQAVAAGDEAATEAAVAELLDTPWSSPPTEALAGPARSYRFEKESARRAAELAEDLALLRESEKDWNRERADRLLRHIADLDHLGTPTTGDDAALVASLRERCDRETAEEKAEARWSELQQALHAAVQHGNPDEIRAVMAAPEFLDRAPDEDLLRAARLVIRHADEARARRTRNLAALMVAILLVIGSATSWAYQRREFRRECEETVGRLEDVATAPRAHEQLREALDKLQKDNPKVYAASSVGETYERRLKRIVDDRKARLARTEERLATLEAERTEQWAADAGLIERQLQDAASEILAEDVDLARRLDEIRLSWERTQSERHEALVASAEKELAPLEKQGENLSKRLAVLFLDKPLEQELADFRHKAALWRSHYAKVAEAQAARLDRAENGLVAPEKKSREAAAALARLRMADTPSETLAARDALRSHYNGFQGVAACPPLPFVKETVDAALDGSLPEQARFQDRSSPITPERFASFLENNVLVLENLPSLFSVYGLDNGKALVGLSTGRPTVSSAGKSSVGANTIRVEGDCLDLRTREKTRTLEYQTQLPVPKVSVLLAPCSELRDVVDMAKEPDLVPSSFAARLYRLVDGHVKAARAPGYGERERRENAALAADQYPAYMRVRMLKNYVEWLKALQQLPQNPGGPDAAALSKIQSLGGIVSVDGVEDGISWTCLLDERIHRRNVECANFLESLPATFPESLRRAAAGADRLQELGRWKIEFAGKFDFRPDRPRDCVPLALPGVKADHPLYVLRRNGTRTFLRKILVAGKAKDSWLLAAGTGDKWLPGEPLFQVRTPDGTLVDAEEAVLGLLSKLPKENVSAFLSGPFWLEGKWDRKETP